MILPVVKYGTPVLRQKGQRIETITPAIRKLIADMLETMYAHKGVGLAAHQVGLGLQLTVLDVSGITDRPSSLELAGQPAEVGGLMPLVLINPEVTPLGEPAAGSPSGVTSGLIRTRGINPPTSAGWPANSRDDGRSVMPLTSSTVSCSPKPT